MNEEILRNLAESVCIVEANSNEQQMLWKAWSSESDANWYPAVRWQAVPSGYGITVGILANRPVVISLTWARINGKLVTFYYGTSQLVDYVMIDKWFDENYFKKYDRNRRDHETNGANFHQCINVINRD